MDRKHWYCFSFSHPKGFACSYAGFPSKDFFPMHQITRQKQAAMPEYPPSDMVLLSVSYLGKMSREAFTGEVE